MYTPTAGMAFGHRVRELRTLKGLSQEALAIAANINKETVYRIERGKDTRATTIGKIRQVLPGLDNNDGLARVGVPDEGVAILELDHMASRIGHLIQGFHTEERLHRVRQFVIQQLAEEQAETTSPRLRDDMRLRQEHAERALVADNSGKRGRKRTNGSGKRSQH